MSSKIRGFGGARKPVPAPADEAITSAVKRFGLDEDNIVAQAKAAGGVIEADKHLVIPDPDQPRKTFDQQKHQELRASIVQSGLLQPLIVRSRADGQPGWLIIAGERRWRAIMDIPGLETIQIIVRDDIESSKILLAQLIENIQREDMTPLDTAMAFQRIMDEQGLKQRELGELVGMSESMISTYMSMLKAPAIIQTLAGSGDIKDVTLLTKLSRLAKADEKSAEELIAGITTGELTATGARHRVGAALKVVKEKPNAKPGGKAESRPEKPQPKMITRLQVAQGGFHWLSGSDEPVLQIQTPQGSYELTFPGSIDEVIAALQQSAEERAG